MDSCCGEGRNNEEIVRYFDRRLGRYDKRHRGGLGRISIAIADALGSQGVPGRSLLEIGPGYGDLTLRLLDMGAAKAQGIDLTPAMAEAAKRNASAAGYAAKTEFLVGDAAAMALSTADIVVLDRVLCCYPVLEPLLNSAAESCDHLFAFSVPNDNWFWGALWRLGTAIEKVGLRLRGCRAYTYVHSTNRIDSILKARGFGLVFQKGVGSWLVRVYRAGGVVP